MDDLTSLDLNSRLFGNSPNPAENRPGLDQRFLSREVAQSDAGVEAARPSSGVSEAEEAKIALLVRRLTALLNNSNITASLPTYGAPHLWSNPVDLSGQVIVGTAVSDYQTVLSFIVPPGRWLRVAGYGVDVTLPANYPYDGSLLWRIQKNGINVETLADWGQHRGSVIQPRETFILGNGNIGTNSGGGDRITFDVRRAVAAASAATVNMVLTGWTWRPRNDFEGTRSGITAF